jgi:signal peptidase I
MKRRAHHTQMRLRRYLGVAVGAASIGAIAGVRRAGWSVRRVVVTGESMRPTLERGDRVVVVRGARRLRRDDVVALVDPEGTGGTVIKRIAARPGQSVTISEDWALHAGDGYVVLGDQRTLSTDSRHYGPVSLAAIRGRVVYRYHPPARSGRVR